MVHDVNKQLKTLILNHFQSESSIVVIWSNAACMIDLLKLIFLFQPNFRQSSKLFHL